MIKGICTKCKKQGTVIMHHDKGYLDEHKDEVHPYCRSCHAKIHKEWRKAGKCIFTPKEVIKLSKASHNRRRKRIVFTEYLMPNVLLVEEILDLDDDVLYSAYFCANNGKKLYYIDI